MIWSPVDEFFDYRYGSYLHSHGFSARDNQRRASISGSREPQRASTRVTEFKYLTGQEHTKTSIVTGTVRRESILPCTTPRKRRTLQYKALAEATGRTFRGAVGDIQVLQHGPSRGSGSHDIQSTGGTQQVKFETQSISVHLQNSVVKPRLNPSARVGIPP